MAASTVTSFVDTGEKTNVVKGDRSTSTIPVISTGGHASASERHPIFLLSADYSRREKYYRPNRDPVAIERSNLLNLTKLVVKELIESSLKFGRMLDSDHPPLQHFFILLEHVLRHGLKPKKGILGPKKELWNVLEAVEKFVPEAADITTSVRDLPTVKSQLGRARAWLRLALMQKKLADYFRLVVDKKDELLRDFYEDDALILSEEAIVIGGLLVGLNVIDCNLCVKEEDLDSQQGVIDFGLYLRENSHSDVSTEGVEPASMTAVLDQKNYIEELNRHLNATVTNLQQKVEQLQTTNALMKEDLAISKNQILTLEEENRVLREHQDSIVEDHQRKLQNAKADMCAERETLQANQAGLDSLYTEVRRQLSEEVDRRQEAEMALKLLEKDIHEKQDSIVSLRRQLEDIKAINLQLFNKLQDCESSLKAKTEQAAKLEQKVAQLTASLKDAETKRGPGPVLLIQARVRAWAWSHGPGPGSGFERCPWPGPLQCSSPAQSIEKQKQAFEETTRSLGQQLIDKDQKRSLLESDLKIEREWRVSLQATVADQQEEAAKLQRGIDAYQQMAQDHERLKVEFSELERKCAEHELTLEELGCQLSESKLQVADLKENNLSLKEAVWTSDKDASCCRQCSKPFSVARRKHHCRSCGEIFCHACSDNTMPLPSSAKPVRVCDTCQTVLLQRYSATS
ncbi:RUN and FYVE domain-containing protein 2-like isoform X2 [Dermacentor andersoni]|uniref:RUN and FYVE domain-containing protein 2-like isoform X2 n=1 Tax=Dermacentor andersoni TaxID=34620 RepID=UPI002417316B|nr:RUN and FYVE domain-containing protein 2-like isoform X2 [Dermacentor andersoni]